MRGILAAAGSGDQGERLGTVLPLIRLVELKAAMALSRVAHPLDDLAQLRAIGFDNKVYRRRLAEDIDRLFETIQSLMNADAP